MYDKCTLLLCTDQVKRLCGSDQGAGQTDVAGEGVDAVELATEAWQNLKHQGVLHGTKQSHRTHGLLQQDMPNTTLKSLCVLNRDDNNKGGKC